MNKSFQNIEHLVTVPKPKIEGTDALWNEVKKLENEFKGISKSIFPFNKPTSLIPNNFIGFQEIFRKENRHTITHIHSPFLHYFPFLKNRKNPIIFSVATSIEIENLRKIEQLKTLDQIIVTSEFDKKKLTAVGFENVESIIPGVDLSNINPTEKRKNRNPFKILMASAPWEQRQIEKKGYPLIFEFLKQQSNYHFTILLRGSFENEIKNLAKVFGVEKQCTFVNKKVNINDFLTTVDATLLIAKDQKIIKSFPHSLLESLAANKPVVSTANIAFGNFIQKHKCGLVLKNFTLNELENVLLKLSENYEDFQAKTYDLTNHFSVENWIIAHKKIYQKFGYS